MTKILVPSMYHNRFYGAKILDLLQSNNFGSLKKTDDIQNRCLVSRIVANCYYAIDPTGQILQY